MDINQAVRSVLSQYATFTGRACRSEYWWFFLANIIAQAIANVVDVAILNNTQLVSGVLSLVLLVPGLAVSVRRLHDIGKSGWNLLWLFLPLIGFILLLVWNVRKGDTGDNAYGPDPLAAEPV